MNSKVIAISVIFILCATTYVAQAKTTPKPTKAIPKPTKGTHPAVATKTKSENEKYIPPIIQVAMTLTIINDIREQYRERQEFYVLIALQLSRLQRLSQTTATIELLATINQLQAISNEIAAAFASIATDTSMNNLYNVVNAARQAAIIDENYSNLLYDVEGEFSGALKSANSRLHDFILLKKLLNRRIRSQVAILRSIVTADQTAEDIAHQGALLSSYRNKEYEVANIAIDQLINLASYTGELREDNHYIKDNIAFLRATGQQANSDLAEFLLLARESLNHDRERAAASFILLFHQVNQATLRNSGIQYYDANIADPSQIASADIDMINILRYTNTLNWALYLFAKRNFVRDQSSALVRELATYDYYRAVIRTVQDDVLISYM